MERHNLEGSTVPATLVRTEVGCNATSPVPITHPRGNEDVHGCAIKSHRVDKGEIPRRTLISANFLERTQGANRIVSKAYDTRDPVRNKTQTSSRARMHKTLHDNKQAMGHERESLAGRQKNKDHTRADPLRG